MLWAGAFPSDADEDVPQEGCTLCSVLYFLLFSSSNHLVCHHFEIHLVNSAPPKNL